jgi:hypothetical protein
VTAVLPAASRAASCGADQLPALTQALLAEQVGALPGAVSATVVTVAGPRLRPWAGAGPAGPDVDRLQARTGQGPAFPAAADADGRPVVSGDLWADERWRLPSAHGTPPVRSVVATALPGPERARAVLAVYGADDDLLQAAAGGALAAVVPDLAAAVCVVRARLEVADLQVALTTNRTIGAAIGITMVSRHLPYEQAAELLRTLSNHTNTRLGELAEEILFTGLVPDPPGR